MRHDLGRDYPGLAANIRGEESSSFTNTLGETLRIRVCEDAQKTAKLLEQVKLEGSDGFDFFIQLKCDNLHSSTNCIKFRFWTATASSPSSLLRTFTPTHLRWLKMSLPTSGSSPRRAARCRLKILGYGSIQLVRLFYSSSSRFAEFILVSKK